MCGIAGIMRVWASGEGTRALATPPKDSIPEAWLDVLDESIRHRGPDGQGRFRDRAIRADGCVVDIALVHRRLSIIDHAGGGQPMVGVGRGRGVVTGTKRWSDTPGLGLYERNAGELGSWAPEVSAARINEPDGRIAVVFNGCIYNHRELRSELQRAGHSFSTDHSDTEVLVHGWREWNAGLLARLDGMFACAFWDRHAASVTLACDLAGQKPLYWSAVTDPNGANLLSFGSCVPGLVRLHHGAGLTVRQGMPDVTAQRIAELERSGARAGDPVTIIRGGQHPMLDVPSNQVDLRGAELKTLHRIQEESRHRVASHVEVDPWLRFGFGTTLPIHEVSCVGPAGIVRGCGGMNEWRIDRYTSPTTQSLEPFQSAASPLTPESVERLLHESIGVQLEADVPVGVALSGGLDSGLIAVFAAKWLAERGQKLQTFTVAMPEGSYDESDAAAATAAHIGCENIKLECLGSAATDLVQLVHQLGLPFGDSSLLPTSWLFAAMRSRVGVAIGGDGGDELFGGYNRHMAMPAIQVLRRFALALRMLPSIHGPARSRRERLGRLLEAASGHGYSDLLAIFPTRVFERLTHRSACAIGLEGLPDRPWLEDFRTYLPYDLLRKSDTASMSSALELRSPMLSRDLIRSSHATPASAILLNGQRKGLLRHVARKHLPAEIVDRPKAGFAIPIGEWFRSDYGGLRTLLLDHLNSVEPFGPPSLGIDLNIACVRQMLDEHLGTGRSGLIKRDHSQRLYMLLVLSVWAKWLGGIRAV